MSIYIPAEDSYLLEKHIKKLARNKSVLDIGSGSGIQALAAIKAKALSVTAADINPESLKLLKERAKAVKNIKIIQSDLFSKIKPSFDLIVFNPPYLPLDKREPEDSRLATTGGRRGDEIIIKFIGQSKKHLNPDGSILIILSSLTPHDKISKLLKKLSFSHKIIDTKKLFFETLELWQIKNSQD